MAVTESALAGDATLHTGDAVVGAPKPSAADAGTAMDTAGRFFVPPLRGRTTGVVGQYPCGSAFHSSNGAPTNESSASSSSITAKPPLR